jgi:hypothetical protein
MPRLIFDDQPEAQRIRPQAPQVGVLEDVARSAAAGVGRGVASIPGLLGDLQTGGEAAAVWGRRMLAGDEEAEALRQSQERAGRVLPTTEEVVKAAAPYAPGITYDPQTTAGEYTRTGLEFGTGAALTAPLAGARTAGQIARTAIGTGVIPGLASEAAGQATEGTALEPWARGAAAIGTGVAGHALTSPTNAQQVLGRAAGNVTPEQLQAAEELFLQAQAMGVPVTRGQALHTVTGGATSLPDVQRVMEGSGALRGFFAPTAEGIQTAGRNALDEIVSPQTSQQAMVGPEAAKAADQALGRVRRRINDLETPLYDRAKPALIPAEDMAVLMNDPVYRQTIAELRTDPRLQAEVNGLPDNSVAFNDVVQRRMGEILDRNDPVDPRSTTPMERRGVERPRQLVREAANMASAGEYGNALAEAARLRERYLDPLMAGPLGGLMRSKNTQGAIDTLFPQGKVQPSPGEISRAVSGLVNSEGGEMAARQLVRSYLQGTFDQATRSIQSGPNQWGGATFNAAVRGNPAMRANLEAAITSLPNGRETWAGFERFLDVMEATGSRQRMGSGTSFNNELIGQMQRGGAVTDVAKTLTGSPLSFPARIREQIDTWNMGRSVDQLAGLMTDPRMAGRFRELATAAPGSAKSMRLVASLAATAQRAQNADREYEPGQSLAAPRPRKLRFD